MNNTRASVRCNWFMETVKPMMFLHNFNEQFQLWMSWEFTAHTMHTTSCWSSMQIYVRLQILSLKQKLCAVILTSSSNSLLLCSIEVQFSSSSKCTRKKTQLSTRNAFSSSHEKRKYPFSIRSRINYLVVNFSFIVFIKEYFYNLALDSFILSSLE